MAFALMDLPFDKKALEPHISEETLEYHHGKHHRKYVDTLNSLTDKDVNFEGKSLIEIIKKSQGPLFNNAAQVFNHDFYWQGLSPQYSTPSVDLRESIERDFSSLDAFKNTFLDAAASLFGSGWVWLEVDEKGRLFIEKKSNAENPIGSGKVPLLTCDVWEHAYYIDYRNARPKYLDAWWELVNWQFVSENYANYRTTHELYSQPCNENTDTCGYVDAMQENERVAT